MKTKPVQVVMLPTEGNMTIADKEPKDSSEVPKGTKCYSFTGIKKCIQEFFSNGHPQPLFNALWYSIAPYNGYAPEMWQPQHLYFISVEKQQVKVGDWIYRNGMVFEASIADADELDHCVVASTDPDLGLPAIPSTWIRDVYVLSNGSIKEVKLKIDADFDDWYEQMELKSYPYYKLKLTPDNEVIVDESNLIGTLSYDFENDKSTFKPIKDNDVEQNSIMNQDSYTKDEFDYVLKHVVPIDQRKEWAQANKHKIKKELDPLVREARNWHIQYMNDHNIIPGTKLAFIAGAEFGSKESVNHAMEFAKWTQQNDWWYIDKHDYWMEGKWFESESEPELKTIPAYSTKQLYELWQQNKNK